MLCMFCHVAYRVQEDREEKFPSSDALVQLLGASWVFIIEDCVGEQTTGLPGQHLKHKTVISYLYILLVLIHFTSYNLSTR